MLKQLPLPVTYGTCHLSAACWEKKRHVKLGTCVVATQNIVRRVSLPQKDIITFTKPKHKPQLMSNLSAQLSKDMSYGPATSDIQLRTPGLLGRHTELWNKIRALAYSCGFEVRVWSQNCGTDGAAAGSYLRGYDLAPVLYQIPSWFPTAALRQY